MINALKSAKHIGFIMSPSLGDALFSMIIPHNLNRHGYRVTVFNNFLYALRSWFPDADIQPWPQIEVSREILKSFDLLLYVYHYNDKKLHAKEWHPNIVFLNDYPVYHRAISMADIQIAICKELFSLSEVQHNNGMLRHPDAKFRSKPRQVAIHPTGASPDKHWLPKKFVALAEQLQTRGFDPIFLVSPKEKELTSWVLDHGLKRIEPTSIDVVAQHIYESGWFIGSDSGLGHLASSLGIPTITLMARHSICRRWRPSFAPNKVLLPPFPMLFKSWKAKYWKHFVSVQSVLKAFLQLTQEHPVS
ncbi:MAG TPA: glycosyltransferase family 9 protein [Gammaproteobacteria bacterium]|nr:glycosyltransferase family 9 protein [Gammaproteobacteria bacterium]